MAGEAREGKVWQPGQRFGRRDARGRLILDEPSANYLNALVLELRRRNPMVGTPPVNVSDGPGGREVTVGLPRKVWARLSGTTNPYDFVEQEWDPSGPAWVDGGGHETGTGNAWEANLLDGLDDKVVLLRWEETAGEWRFAYVGRAPNPPCPLCVRVENICHATDPTLEWVLTGATVTVKDDATPPNTVGTGTTTGMVTGVFLSNQGSGYSPSDPPTVGFSGGGGTGAAATAHLYGGALSGLTLTASGGGYITPHVGFSGGSGTGAAARAFCSVDGATLTDGGTGYANGTHTDGLFIDDTGDGDDGTFSYDVVGGVVQPGITVTDGGSGYEIAPRLQFGATGGTAAHGTATLAVDSLLLTIPGSLYESATVSITDSSGTGSGATATVATATIKVHYVEMTAGGSGYTSTPSVAISSTTGSGAAGTATVTVQFCVDITDDGTYTVTASKTGYITQSKTVTVPPCSPVTMKLYPTMISFWAGVTPPCGAGYVGFDFTGAFLIEAIQGGTTIDSALTTNADNSCVKLTVPSLVPTFWKATPQGNLAGRMPPFTSSTFTPGCSGFPCLVHPNNIMGISPGYNCDGNSPTSCAAPTKDTLHLSTPFGAVTLTRVSGGLPASPVRYEGSQTAGWGGCPPDCYPSGVGISYAYNGANLSWAYSVDPLPPRCAGVGLTPSAPGVSGVFGTKTCPFASGAYSWSLTVDFGTVCNNSNPFSGLGIQTFTITE